MACFYIVFTSEELEEYHACPYRRKLSLWCFVLAGLSRTFWSSWLSNQCNWFLKLLKGKKPHQSNCYHSHAEMQPLLYETVWERGGSTSFPFPHRHCVTASLRPAASVQWLPPRVTNSQESDSTAQVFALISFLHAPLPVRPTVLLIRGALASSISWFPSAVFSLLLPTVPCSPVLSSERQNPDPFTRTVQKFISVCLLLCSFAG